MLIVAIIVGGVLFLKGCGANLTSALHHCREKETGAGKEHRA